MGRLVRGDLGYPLATQFLGILQKLSKRSVIRFVWIASEHCLHSPLKGNFRIGTLHQDIFPNLVQIRNLDVFCPQLPTHAVDE